MASPRLCWPSYRSTPPTRTGPASCGRSPAAYDGTAELERGLDILLTGLTTTLTPPGQTRPPVPAQHPVG